MAETITDVLRAYDVLRSLVEQAKCKPGWTFRLAHAIMERPEALVLKITVHGQDSRYPDDLQPFIVSHSFPVPWATYNAATWLEWMFKCCQGVENHELGEWFRIDTDRPFQPLHGPGEDPYTVHLSRPPGDALITQDGSVREPYTT
jgi:hypothetical protein